MKLLLVGPYPPPHGGISVHVRGLEQRSLAAGVPTRILDSNGAGPELIFKVLLHSVRGWTIHFHTNGHNLKSWILAGICGLAAKFGPDGILTLHSGMVPGYLAAASPVHRLFARFVCALYGRVICVSIAIRTAITGLGVRITRTEIAEAYLGVQKSHVDLRADVERWIYSHSPLLSTALFFRPEYGFDVLLSALRDLRRTHPLIGCVVMGDSENQSVAKQQVEDAGLEKNILLTGDVDHSTCVNVMSRCDAFIRPTLEDGDSVSVREAAGLGIPVVASNVGTRPAEAILFRRGDPAALSEKIRIALERPRSLEQYA